MTPQSYRGEVTSVSTSVAEYVARVLFSLTTRSLSLKGYAALILVLFPRIRDGRLSTLSLAADFYMSERDKHRIKTSFTASNIGISLYTPQAVAKILEPMKPALTGSGSADRSEIVKLTKSVSSRASLHVEQGARDGLVSMVKADQTALGWARVDPSPPSCEFCTMLISRGPAYKNRPIDDSGGFTNNTYHPNDTCISVPVFSKTGWAGEQQYRAAKKIYKEALQIAGSRAGTNEILKAIRESSGPGDRLIPLEG